MSSIREILEKVAKRDIDVDEAIKRLKIFELEYIDDKIRYDLGRELRRDIPEIVFAEKKDLEELEKIIRSVVPKTGRIIISRLRKEHINYLKNLKIDDLEIEVFDRGRIAVVRKKDFERRKHQCTIGILTAGTADISVAEECRIVVEEMGCRAISIYDVGVAGLHRVIEALKKVKDVDADVVIVVAGMEGALPSVVASLIDVPVIAVPTSVGYGLGGEGIAALYSMLQACPLGLAVVNIDNGVNAAVLAALIGKRISLYREKCKEGLMQIT
ncbi:MAG: nickel pincer cofactor biosynthesis protein LarB [Ignisphaera sp.]